MVVKFNGTIIMKKKLPKQVLEGLEANPNISPSVLEAVHKASISDEGGGRIHGKML